MKFTDLIQSGIKVFGLRFIVLNIIPMSALFMFFMALVWSGAPAHAPDFDKVIEQVRGFESSDWILLSLYILLFTLLFQPVQLYLVKFLEGYWGDSVIARFFRKIGVWIQKQKREKLIRLSAIPKNWKDLSQDEKDQIRIATHKLLRYYPDYDRLMPTQLGNALRTAEERPEKRYELDAVTFWPMIEPYISEPLKKRLEDQRLQLDTAARLTIVFLIAFLVSLYFLWRWPVWLTLPLGFLVLSWLAYKLTVVSAIGYGKSVEVAFDLHRFDMYEALRVGKPDSIEEEKIHNKKLSDFYRQFGDLKIAYDPKEEKSKKTPEAKPKSGVKTSVLLVIKGIGPHKPDDTLDLFLKGFLPAVWSNTIAKVASIRERADIYTPEHDTVHDNAGHNHVTEFVFEKKGKKKDQHRIWLKEVYWEGALRPPSSLSALLGEWQIATYALGRVIFDILVSPFKLEFKYKWPNYFISSFFKHFLVLLFPIWSFLIDPDDVYSSRIIVLALSINIIVSVLFAFTEAILIKDWYTQKYKDRDRLQGISGWVLPFLLISIINNFSKYLIMIGLAILILLILLIGRVRAWKYSLFKDSDTNFREYFQVPNGKHTFSSRLKPPYESLMYRLLLVMLLPVGFLLIALAQFLIFTKVLEWLGNALMSFSNMFFANSVGDIVSYAREPDQALRLRSLLIKEIDFFYNHQDVNDIHIFAHSFGTVIGYETLYDFMPRRYQGKIKTFVTIGTVLNAMRKANPVLDDIYKQRFPVYLFDHDFPQDFRWFNLWNMLDPATEFYALDEFELVRSRKSLRLESKKGKTLPVMSSASPASLDTTTLSPINVRTKVMFDPHSGYWKNLEDVHAPLVERILSSGTYIPERWDKKPTKSWPVGKRKKYISKLALSRLTWLVIVPAIVAGVFFLGSWLNKLIQLPKLDSGISIDNVILSQINMIWSWFTSNETKNVLLWGILIFAGIETLLGYINVLREAE